MLRDIDDVTDDGEDENDGDEVDLFYILAGSSGGDQSGRINSSHSIIEELARSDWMELSGGDQSGSFLAI